MIAFLIFLLVLFFISSLVPRPDELDKGDGKFVVQKKQCPPHQWYWQEIVDQHGEKQGERIVCKVCGPLKSREE